MIEQLRYCLGCKQPSLQTGFTARPDLGYCRRVRQTIRGLTSCGQPLLCMPEDERGKATQAAYLVGGWDAAIAMWLTWTS